ncbi:hypothetical protein BV22DRAFT_1046303 [Leucogyrophana mollusca]|uniref:Uncharacterized protein n=1 Tax=Leucogyrophana mollusca TaxID=85980 RepID=A0ACB8BLI9_9AGAM|nr:hypothetical protein BV22DRAFT_1046303 [Leucogyrophana mollusca]
MTKERAQAPRAIKDITIRGLATWGLKEERVRRSGFLDWDLAVPLKNEDARKWKEGNWEIIQGLGGTSVGRSKLAFSAKPRLSGIEGRKQRRYGINGHASGEPPSRQTGSRSQKEKSQPAIRALAGTTRCGDGKVALRRKSEGRGDVEKDKREQHGDSMWSSWIQVKEGYHDAGVAFTAPTAKG